MTTGALFFDLTRHHPMTYNGNRWEKATVAVWGHSAHPAEELQVFCSAKGEMGPGQGED